MEKTVELRIKPTTSNTFKINSEGRPEGTCRTDKGVVHYTCNSPEDKILEQFGIKGIGDEFVKRGLCNKDLDKNEVLLIPEKIFEDFGIDKMGTIETEALLTKLSNKNKR